MKVHRDLRTLPPEARGCAIAIGNFDGVHRGHRAVIETARRQAAEAATARAPNLTQERTDGGLGVLTFEPHPKEVVSPATAPRRLTPLRRKIELLTELGVDHLFLLDFDEQLMAMSATAFIETILIEQLELRALAVGEGFRFGHKRQGDAELLVRVGAAKGFAVEALPALMDGSEPCSSTRIRNALADGELELANRLLSRPLGLSGIVEGGDKRGRTIGFPTANIRLDGTSQALPANGVYAVEATLHREGDGQALRTRLPGVANLGRRPTFDGEPLLLEVHLFDVDMDLYGQRLDVTFVERLRGEVKFSGIDELRAQITRDCEAARHKLGLAVLS